MTADREQLNELFKRWQALNDAGRHAVFCQLIGAWEVRADFKEALRVSDLEHIIRNFEDFKAAIAAAVKESQ